MPHALARALQCEGSVRHDMIKGAILGACNALTIALLFGVGIALGETEPVTVYSLVGGELWKQAGGPPSTSAVIFEVLRWGIPAGSLWGMMFGSMTESVRAYTPAVRTGSYLLVAVSAMLVSGAFWPELVPYALGPTAVYAVVLARWALPRQRSGPLARLPEAIVVSR